MAFWYHRTTDEVWEQIQQDGHLWGVPGWGTLKERLEDVTRRCRYTYLSPDDWGDTYGDVLLEVEYDPRREDASTHVGGYLKKRDRIKHNYGFDPPPGQRCAQFSVFEPISLDKVRRLI
jgi:hypothetical protein